jgi:Fe-S cluster assembly ATPase SufC
MAAAGAAVLLITHRDEMVVAADSASLLCAGSIVYRGDPAQVREFYADRCRPHLGALGAQPWEGRQR